MNERLKRNLGVLLLAAVAVVVGLAIGSSAGAEGVSAGVGAALAGGGGLIALLTVAATAVGLIRGDY